MTENPTAAGLSEAEREALFTRPRELDVRRDAEALEVIVARIKADAQDEAYQEGREQGWKEACADEDRMREAVEALRSALERTEANFIAAVNGRPVRDMSETLAENRAALAPHDACPKCIEKYGQVPSAWGDSVEELDAYKDHAENHAALAPTTHDATGGGDD